MHTAADYDERGIWIRKYLKRDSYMLTSPTYYSSTLPLAYYFSNLLLSFHILVTVFTVLPSHVLPSHIAPLLNLTNSNQHSDSNRAACRQELAKKVTTLSSIKVSTLNPNLIAQISRNMTVMSLMSWPALRWRMRAFVSNWTQHSFEESNVSVF